MAKEITVERYSTFIGDHFNLPLCFPLEVLGQSASESDVSEGNSLHWGNDCRFRLLLPGTRTRPGSENLLCLRGPAVGVVGYVAV
jgi:hypothetical protein